eukprot:6907937-Prorocentrum_lima.AAC.1
MTSSLVGSEMCIRDREGRPVGKHFGRRRATAVGGISRNAPRSFPPKAVSYTHLTLPTICSV